MKKILLFASIVVFLASCSSKPTFKLEVGIRNNNSLKDKQLVFTQQIDGKVVFADTTKIKKNNFSLKIPYKGPGLLFVSILQSNIGDILLAAEDGIVQLNVEGNKTHIGGTLLNDRLQIYYTGSDSVSLLLENLDKEYALQQSNEPDNPNIHEEYRQKRNSLLEKNTDRIVAFIRENVDNPVGEYYFLTNYITLPFERKKKCMVLQPKN